MSNTFTAQELADFYQKVADGGEVEFRANCTDKQWFSASGSPCLSSVRQDWRIKPTKKVIDLSVLIDSQIDCEFYDELDFDEEQLRISFLTSIDCSRYPYSLGCDVYSFCRPRMNHKHAWDGGDCPLPEGFKVKVCMRDNSVRGDMCSHFNWKWSYKAAGSDIIQFEVLGLADGYVMPWEQDNEHSV